MLSLFKKKSSANILDAYISGNICPIADVPDEIFSKKLMGEGVAIIAKDCTLYSPSDGVITLIAPTKHAIAIQIKDEIQLLIHIGLDSALHKEGVFTVLVEQGEQVRCGEPLIQISSSYLETSNPLYIPLVVVENPYEKVFSFSDRKEVTIGKKDMIASYE